MIKAKTKISNNWKNNSVNFVSCSSPPYTSPHKGWNNSLTQGLLKWLRLLSPPESHTSQGLRDLGQQPRNMGAATWKYFFPPNAFKLGSFNN